jgi:catechol 2,3-dioxygenase-like lactoylglutathione lyase family enzyme
VFDHVTVSVSDLEAAREFYETGLAILGFGEPRAEEDFFEWEDLTIGRAGGDRPPTHHLHVGLVARSRAQVDEFWETLTDKGFRDDGAPGTREKYSPSYYGAFLLDPDGNSIEAVHHDNARSDGAAIDHVWLRVRDVVPSTRFYATIAPVLGFRFHTEHAGRAHFAAKAGGFTLTLPDEGWSAERPLTENVHLAFPAPDRATVDEFHRVAMAAGYRDNGAPGERSRYHPGYYAAYVLDPDGNNVEAVFHGRDAAG